MPIRVLLVDDSLEFLRALSRLLSSDPEIEIVGQAYSACDALEKMNQVQVDLVLMDIKMPGTNGLEVTRQIKARANAPRVLILTLYDCNEYRTAAKTVCADGFVSKLASDDELLPLIYALFAIPSGPATGGTSGNSVRGHNGGREPGPHECADR